MKLIDLISKYEVLVNELSRPCTLTDYVKSQEDVKREEERIRKKNEEVVRKLNEVDELMNRIVEIMATNYIEIRGIKYSLLVAKTYITKGKGGIFGFEDNGAYVMNYKLPRLDYLESYNNAQDTKSLVPDATILVDPLGLHDKSNNAVFEFISEIKSEYIKQLTTIEV